MDRETEMALEEFGAALKEQIAKAQTDRIAKAIDRLGELLSKHQQQLIAVVSRRRTFTMTRPDGSKIVIEAE